MNAEAKVIVRTLAGMPDDSSNPEPYPAHVCRNCGRDILRSEMDAYALISGVGGANERKDNGGILFRTVGNKMPSRFDGLTIERNIVWKVDRSAIVGQSTETARSRWYPSLHVVIRDNYAEDIGGDGIVPWASDGALSEMRH